jgi:hypothetical protein
VRKGGGETFHPPTVIRWCVSTCHAASSLHPAYFDEELRRWKVPELNTNHFIRSTRTGRKPSELGDLSPSSRATPDRPLD